MNATLTQLPSPVLVIGPAYCGKSEWAHQLLSPALEANVLGTTPAEEPSLWPRVLALRELRPPVWESLTVGADLSLALHSSAHGKTSKPQILVDSISQWLGLLIAQNAALSESKVEELMSERLKELGRVVASMDQTRLVMVSAEVGAAPPPVRPLERCYRQWVGTANRSLAAMCPTVVSMQAGIPTFLKGYPSRSTA